MTLIKEFKNRIPHGLQVLLVILISAYTLVFGVSYHGPIFDVIRGLLPVLLIVASAILLTVYRKSLAGHAVLLLGIYVNALTAFANELFDIHFNPFEYSPHFTLTMIIHALIFLYLFLIVLSHFLKGHVKTAPLTGKTVRIGVCLLLFVWVFYGFSSAISLLILPLIGLIFGLKLPALLLMLSVVIDEPFRLIDHAVNGTLNTWSTFDILYVAIAIMFVVVIIIQMGKVGRSKTY